MKVTDDMVERAEDKWSPISTAPKNASWFIGRTADGKEYRVHFASDLSGSEQPPFEGFFQDWYGYGFSQVLGLVEWRPESALNPPKTNKRDGEHG